MRRWKECPFTAQVMEITVTQMRWHRGRWRTADTFDVHLRDRVQETRMLIPPMQQGKRKRAVWPSGLGHDVTESGFYRDRGVRKSAGLSGRSWVQFGVCEVQTKLNTWEVCTEESVSKAVHSRALQLSCLHKGSFHACHSGVDDMNDTYYIKVQNTPCVCEGKVM